MILMANILSLTSVFSYIIPSLLYVRTMDWWYVQLVGGLVATNIGIELVKPMFGSRGGFGRPAGAWGCDVFCSDGAAGGRPGFPSSHMAIVTMVVSALWWHTRSSILIVGVPWIAAMAWSRWMKRCHNWQQIVAGTVVGLVCGSFYA